MRLGLVGAGEPLPVQPHLREGYQRLDNCGLDAEGGQWDRAVQCRDGLLQQQDGLHQGGDRQVELLQCDSRRSQQIGQWLGPVQRRAPEQSPSEVVDGNPHGTEGLRTGPAAVLMPLLVPGGLVGG